MRYQDSTLDHNMDLQDAISVCGGMPRGDELPQVAGVEDILMDVYSDVLNMPREYAAGVFHHQTEDDFSYGEMIH